MARWDSLPTQDNYFLNAMLKTITDDLRVDLRERVMKVLDPEIDEAIQSVVDALRLRLEAHRDCFADQAVFNVFHSLDRK